MKKQLTAMAMIGCMMTATAQAFVPLSNSQINLGSFRNNATRGMFYTELDIFSASPVEIGDTEGNYIYTNWANLRTNSNLNAGAVGPIAPTPAGGAPQTYDAPLSYNVGGGLGSRFLTLGLSGRPLWFLPVVGGIRAGAVFQNSGAKAGARFGGLNLQGSGGGDVDLELTRSSDTYILYQASYPTGVYPVTTSTQTSPTQILSQNTAVKYYTDTTNTQWNAGAAWKDFVLKDFDIGASLSRVSNQTRLTSGGTKSYKSTYQDDQTFSVIGLPNGTREFTTYNATYAENAGADVASVNQTDILAQARIGFIPIIPNITAGVGLRLARNDNPGSGATLYSGLLDENKTLLGTFERNDVKLTYKDGGATGVAGGGSGTVLNNVLYYGSRETTRNRTALDYPAAPTGGAAGSFNTAFLGTSALPAASLATVDWKDSRSGAGPIARAELSRKFATVTVTAVGNFSTVKQTIDAAQTLQAYSKSVTPTPLSTDTARVATYIPVDVTVSRTWAGSQTNTLLDGGGKVEFTAMEGVRLALGGFISRYRTVTDITSAKYTGTDKTSYDDGSPQQNPGTNFYTTVGPARPVNAAGFEGTFVQTWTREGTSKVDSVVTQIAVPVGVEIPLHKKWTFRAGTRYVMQKANATVNYKRISEVKTTVVSAAGGGTTTYYEQDFNPQEDTITTYPGAATVPGVTAGTSGINTPIAAASPETHYMEYSYGLQFDPTKSLSLAANAFLDTNANAAAPGGLSNASIFDLNTYRLLAIQAVFKF